MTTPQKTLRRIAYEVIQATAPAATDINAIYVEVERQIVFDQADQQPPTHNGKSVGYPRWQRNVRNALQREKEDLQLVNIERGRWMLPPTESTFGVVDAEAGWSIARGNALRALEDHSTFHSTQEKHRYSIREVLADRILVRRLDANKDEPVTEKDVSRALSYLNAAGGRSGRGTLNYTVAKEVAMVFLHPQLEWDPSGEWICASGPTGRVPSEQDDALGAALTGTGREGALKLVSHFRRERDSRLIRDFKKRYLSEHQGQARCELCTIDMQSRYPTLDDAYIEAHHREPLSEVSGTDGRDVAYEDIAFLCANCHRVIHRAQGGQYLSIEELRASLRS